MLEYGNTVAFKSNLVDLLGNTIHHVIFMQTSSILAEFQKGRLDYDKDLFFIIDQSNETNKVKTKVINQKKKKKPHLKTLFNV